MADKSVMMLVPRELLERLISATRLARGEGSPTQRAAEAILSAPAEDVRAVVDELEGKLAIRNITIEQLTRKVEELEELVTDLRGNARE